MNSAPEEAQFSRPASGMTINVGLFPLVPATFSYGPPSYAISSSEYTQTEYENVRIADLEHDGRLLNLGISQGLHYYTDGSLEDRITIECIDNTNIACFPHVTEKPSMARLFLARSHLIHSRWFVQWFNSPYYLARASMKVTWHRDPIACWEMAKSYMEDGCDQFGVDQIAAYVSSHFRLAERFIVLIRLCKLARILELSGLMEGGLAALKQIEHLASSANIMTLTRYVFGGEDYCENISQLRKWCLNMVGKHYDWLIKSDQWAKVVKDSVPELDDQWMKIMTIKRKIPQKGFKRVSRQTLHNVKSPVSSITTAPENSEVSTQPPGEDAAETPVLPSTPQKESDLPESTREVPESPTKKGKAKTNIPEMEILQQVHALPENVARDGNFDAESVQISSLLNKNSSLPNSLEIQGSISNKSDSQLKRPVLGAPPAWKSTYRGLLELDMSNDAPVNHSEDDKTDDILSRVADSNRRSIAGSLSTSISEPLLSSRRYSRRSADMSKHVQDSNPFDLEEDPNDIARPASEGAIAAIKARDDPVQQRGVIVTVGALNDEPDSWPLADIPSPDPLLPFPRRAPSLDSGATIREHFAASLHHAQAVTIFGIHRPGMGGSVITIDENAPLKESHGRSPNHAKAREFLGIDTPAPAGIARPKSRISSDTDMKRLKKRSPWLGRLGE